MQLTTKVSRFAMSLLGALAVCCNAVAQTAADPLVSAPTASPQTQLDFFSSQLTLDRVIDRFLQSNLSIEAARYQVDVARAEQIAARIRPNPGFTFSAENLKVSGDTPLNRLYEVSTTYAQTFELGGKRRLRRETADLIVSVAEAELSDVLRQRMFEVKHAYYEAVLARYALFNAMENRTSFDELIQFNKVRFEEGAIAEGELLKVRLERLKFDAAHSQAELAQRQALIKLLQLLGEADYSRAETVAGELNFASVTLDLAQLKEMAFQNRPDVKAAELRVTLAERRIALEHARNSMDVTPFAGYKRVGIDNTILFGVTIPLRFNDRNQAGIARAVAEEKVARTGLALVRNRALAEVESAYRAYETARDQVAAFQRELLEQANESYTISLAAYQEGATELLPLLEAQRTRADIRQQYYRTLFDYQTSILWLEQAVGKQIKP
ncbi:MAG TPA: TolC family protein [Blastocatellia bacterium]|nr:TolC family protein [Blastocatellia bacterium]